MSNKEDIKLNDRDRFVDFMKKLPEESVRFLVDDLWNGGFSSSQRKMMDDYKVYSENRLSEFSNSEINNKYREFNEFFDKLTEFRLQHFFVSQKGFFELLPKLKYCNNLSLTENDAKKREEKFKELKYLVEVFQEKYDVFVKTAKNILEHINKSSLNSFNISFIPQKHIIKIGEKDVLLPSHGNEHCLCEIMFEHNVGESVSWDEVFERMTSYSIVNDSDSPESTRKNWQQVYDTVKRCNKRIKNIINSDDELFVWNNKTITRKH